MINTTIIYDQSGNNIHLNTACNPNSLPTFYLEHSDNGLPYVNFHDSPLYTTWTAANFGPNKTIVATGNFISPGNYFGVSDVGNETIDKRYNPSSKMMYVVMQNYPSI